MVPRDTDHNSRSGAGQTASHLFDAWRRLLGRLASRARRNAGSAARRVSQASSGVPGGLIRSLRTGLPMSARPAALVVLGLAASAVGAAATQFVQPPRSATQGLALAIVSMLWVAARLVVMRLAGADRPVANAETITTAWLHGALVQVIAASPPLRMFAWLAGVVLSLRSLRAAGMTSADAVRLVSWGYGIEVVGFFLVAAGRSLEVALRIFAGI